MRLLLNTLRAGASAFYAGDVLDDATPAGSVQLADYRAMGGEDVSATQSLVAAGARAQDVRAKGNSALADLLTLAAAAKAGGGGNAILWQPSGGGDAVTWDEVMAFVDASKVPVYIYVSEDSSIPAGTYEMKNSFFIGIRLGEVIGEVDCEDGAVLRNLGGLLNDASLQSSSSAPVLDFDYTPGQPIVFVMDKGGRMDNQGSSQMWHVPDGGFVVFVMINGGDLFNNIGAPGVVLLGAGSVLLLVIEGFPPESLSGPMHEFVQGPASALLVFGHFGFAGPYPTPAGFAGAVLNAPLTVVGGSGPTSQRPVPLFGAIPLGCSYLDSDLGVSGLPIWWDGAQWVDATGAGPV